MAMVGCAGPTGKRIPTRNRPAVQPSHNEAMMAILSMWHPTTALRTFQPMPSLPIDKTGQRDAKSARNYHHMVSVFFAGLNSTKTYKQTE